MSPERTQEFDLAPGSPIIVGLFVWRTPRGSIAVTTSNLPDNIGVIVGRNGRRAVVRVGR